MVECPNLNNQGQYFLGTSKLLPPECNGSKFIQYGWVNTWIIVGFIAVQTKECIFAKDERKIFFVGDLLQLPSNQSPCQLQVGFQIVFNSFGISIFLDFWFCERKKPCKSNFQIKNHTSNSLSRNPSLERTHVPSCPCKTAERI